MKDKDRVVIITGGGAGIGLAAAQAFVGRGAHVLITGRNAEKIQSVAQSLPGTVALAADAANPVDARRTIDRAIELWGRIDVLVNNAGAGKPTALADTSIESLHAVYAANTFGPTLLAAAAVPHLIETRGAIVNISSSLGTKPVAGFSGYGASKAALEQLTRCWALELAPSGVRVNAIAPGPVESEFLRERMGLSESEAEAVKARERNAIPLGRRGVPEDVARWIVALAGEDSDWITGQVIAVDGGFTLV